VAATAPLAATLDQRTETVQQSPILSRLRQRVPKV